MTDIQLPTQADEEGPSHSDEAALVAFRSRRSRVMLVVASLVSLGLWAAIWLVLRPLVSALARASFSWQTILATAIVAITISVVIIRFRQQQSS
jgi:magnesium-transporting ATPase (P-type)